MSVQAFQENGKPDLIIDDANGYIFAGTAYLDVKVKIREVKAPLILGGCTGRSKYTTF